MPRTPDTNLEIVVAGKTENVHWDTFIEVSQKTLEILREIDKEVSQDERGTLDWEVISASLNSPLALKVRPVARPPIDARKRVVDAYMSGINTLNQRRTKPKYFNERALQGARQLVEQYDNGALKIQYRSADRIVIPKRAIASHVEAILSPAKIAPPEEYVRKPRREIGSLEGTVRDLQARKQDYFLLKERLTGAEVRCNFPDELDAQVRSAWKKRVRIFGLIHYDDNGQPHMMSVEGIKEIPPILDLPQFKDFGIDITGGIDSADYIRGLRDDD